MFFISNVFSDILKVKIGREYESFIYASMQEFRFAKYISRREPKAAELLALRDFL
jgi:hypothetical protein